MNNTLRAAALAVLTTALGPIAHAQDTTTRDQVRNELAEAMRNGGMMSGEGGLPMREQFPGRYPPPAPRIGLRREQVREELARAIRGGEMMAGGELGWRGNDGIPGAFPKEAMVGGRTRSEVRTELAEAIRTGTMVSAGETALPLNQLHPSLYANVPSLSMMASHGSAGGRGFEQ